MNKKWKAVGRTVLLVFVSLILGLNIYAWNARSLMGNAMPTPFGYGAAVVLTGSMEPAISADDLVIVQARDSYAPGEVVVYQSRSMLVVHRIVAMEDGMVTTRGDANNAADEPIPADQIKGRVILRFPRAGALIRLLKSPAVTIALLAAAIWMANASFRSQQKRDDAQLEQIKEEIRRLKAEAEQK